MCIFTTSWLFLLAFHILFIIKLKAFAFYFLMSYKINALWDFGTINAFFPNSDLLHGLKETPHEDYVLLVQVKYSN